MPMTVFGAKCHEPVLDRRNGLRWFVLLVRAVQVEMPTASNGPVRTDVQERRNRFAGGRKIVVSWKLGRVIVHASELKHIVFI